MIPLTFNQINIDTEFKEQFVALYFKNHITAGCENVGSEKINYDSTKELLSRRFSSSFAIPPDVAHKLYLELMNDSFVLATFRKIYDEIAKHFKGIPAEFLQIALIRLLEIMESRLNQLPQPFNNWEETKRVCLDVLKESSQLYDDLISPQGGTNGG